MKFSTSVLTTLAPVALAKSVHNHYGKEKRDGHLAQEVKPDLGAHLGLSGYGISEDALTEVIVIWVNPGAGAHTTTVNEQHTVTQTVTAGVEHPTVIPGVDATTTIKEGATGTVVGPGATHSVTVGGPAGLVFTPDQINAKVGDLLVMTFFGQNHTATQSSFDTPCDPLAGGMNSGFQPNPDNSVDPPPQVAMQIMVETPLWFYCAQGAHCGKGMTFSINPTAEKTHAMFQSKAIQQRGNGAGSALTGGEAPPVEAPPADAPPADAPPAEAPPAEAPVEGAPEGETPVAPAPVAGTGTPGEAATPVGEFVHGTGTVLPDGSCACAVVVGAGAFPAAGVQGAGSFGGMAGALPIDMAEAI